MHETINWQTKAASVILEIKCDSSEAIVDAAQVNESGMTGGMSYL
jgi:hypothetical protein